MVFLYLPVTQMKVLSIIQNLGGGGGRVLVDVIEGLPQYNHTVYYSVSIGDYSYGFGRELDDLGVIHRQAPSQAHLEKECFLLKPDIVLYHWWRGAPYRKCDNSERVPWVLILHSLMPAPIGYDFYVAVSKACYNIQSHLPSNRKEVIYNGVDLERFNKIEFQPHDGFVIGRVSHLLAKKINTGYVDLIKQLNILGLKVLIVGNGPMKEPLAQRAAQLGIDRAFEFAGKVCHDLLPQQIARFDLSLYLTNIPESFCISLVECLAMGVPVVTEPKGALPELITHNDNGFMSLYNVDLKRYCQLVYKFPELKERLSQGARESAKKFDIKIQQKAYKELMQNILA
ncbi:MAG: glycosyltransferase family 4 protein [bacterium]|nr:glycosyltransferase family 4 protein [bacterium]